MKKILTAISAFIIICAAAGCDYAPQRKQILPIKVTTEDFDLATAVEMVEQLEQPVIYLSSLDEISREELEILRQSSVLFSTDETSYSMLSFFDGADYEDKQKQVLEINRLNVYPTVFDEDVEVTKAYIEYSVYEEEYSFLNSEILYIVEASRSDDKYRNDFLRSYMFTRENNSNWVLKGFLGTLNYIVSPQDEMYDSVPQLLFP